MNSFQELWWQQASSDYAVFLLLRRHGEHPCHLLHYFQMATEKLAKAYFWRTGSPPSKSHVGLRLFLRRLGTAGAVERHRLTALFNFGRFDDLQNWIRSAAPLAYSLERLAPALAQDTGPNPEYPWPHAAPQHAPVTFEFDVWNELTQTGRGRQLQQILQVAFAESPKYA